MATEIEYTDEFGGWFDSLTEAEQDQVAAVIGMLEQHGLDLGFPYSSAILGSRIALRELRKQIHGEPFRVLYAFDPRRMAILLLGGNKGGDDRWYEIQVPRAERLYQQHLTELQKEGLL
jgi:hypothetical protein